MTPEAHLTRYRSRIPRVGHAFTAAWLSLAAWCPSAFGQEPAGASSVGAEFAFRSGHADRGFIINDRPVAQPVWWVSGRVAEFSLWGSLPLAETTDGARPQIVEMELTRAHQWGNLTVAPAIRAYFYHDALNLYDERSIEGWLHLSYDVGPFRLFTHHSLDVQTYRGAYFVDAGIEFDGSVSERVELGGSMGAGWASSRFNDAWAEVATSGINRVSLTGWLAAYVSPNWYIGPHFEFSTMVNDDVRAVLARPTFVVVGVTTGVEF